MSLPRTVPAFLMAVALSTPVLAQDAAPPTSEEFTERAEASERAPLFQSDEPIKITLRTDIEFLRRERNDTLEVEGMVTFLDLDGSEVTKPVDVRVRGNFRRDRSTCNFPPLRLDFPRSQMEGTVFEGQNRLKLVTPCQDDRDEYQRYVFNEYLAYKTFNLLTPASFRVRLLEITYEDINGRYGPRTKMAFVVESDDAMAERSRAVALDVAQMHPIMADGEQSVLTGMFNYMIANLDWSAVFFHNVIVMRTEDGRHLTVPYDFDFSGLVNARYAGVPPQLQDRVRRLRQRLYREFCRPQLEHSWVSAAFNSKRDQINDLFASFPYYKNAEDAKDALDYLEEFWRVIDDPRQFQRQVLADCLEMPR